MEHKFKIGDKVRILGNSHGFGPQWRDKIATIKECCKTNYSGSELGYRIHEPYGNNDTGHFNGIVGESSFELVEINYEIY